MGYHCHWWCRTHCYCFAGCGYHPHQAQEKACAVSNLKIIESCFHVQVADSPLQSCRQFQHEQMLDDMEETRSGHSIGIVENPLYAEEEGEQLRYSDLSAKDKEAEVCLL